MTHLMARGCPVHPCTIQPASCYVSQSAWGASPRRGDARLRLCACLSWLRAPRFCNSRLLVRQYCQGVNTNKMSGENEDAANTRTNYFAIRHPAQQRIARTARSTTKYYVRDPRRPYCSAGDYVGTADSAASNNSSIA